MAKEIDYKIRSFKLTQNGISAKVDIYRGEVTTELENNPDPSVDGETDVTRYRRDLKLKEIQVDLNPQEVADLFRKFVNKKIIKEATERGLTIISEQNSTSV